MGAVLKSSSQWQLKEFLKLNNSGHKLFIFKIVLIVFCKVTSFYLAAIMTVKNDNLSVFSLTNKILFSLSLCYFYRFIMCFKSNVHFGCKMSLWRL